MSNDIYQSFKEYLSQKDDICYQSLNHSVELQRELGLRLRESFAIKKETITKAIRSGQISLSGKDCTKNSNPRSFTLSEVQKTVLKETLSFMRENHLHSLAPTKHLMEHYRFAEHTRQDFIKDREHFRYHDFRHSYAQERLKETGDKQLVSEELGHHREDITKVYLGS